MRDNMDRLPVETLLRNFDSAAVPRSGRPEEGAEGDRDHNKEIITKGGKSGKCKSLMKEV